MIRIILAKDEGIESSGPYAARSSCDLTRGMNRNSQMLARCSEDPVLSYHYC